MPDVTVQNQTSFILNIAFSISTPLAFHNEIEPDQTIHLHLSTFRHHFEARIDSRRNRFSSYKSLTKIGEIGTASLAGVAAVTLGTGWLFSRFGHHDSPTASAALAGAGLAWGAANTMGAQYAQSGEGVIVVVSGLWVPFCEKHYSVRIMGDDFVLWDEDGNHSID